jgi:branched-chain amino acid transport system permease protein
MDSYLIAMVTLAAIYAIMAISLNLSWGLAGMVNLGLAGFVSIGAYSSGLLTVTYGWPVLPAILAALAFGLASGAVLTLLTLRLRDDYLAIVTLGFAEVVRLVITNELWLTHGSDGVSGIPGIIARERGYGFEWSALVISLAAVATVYWLANRVKNSPYGRVLRAIRDDPEGAAVAGKNVTLIKVKTFALSTMVAAIAGAFYAHYTSFISPEIFQPLLTMYVFLALTMGGTGNNLGAITGAFMLIFVLEGSRFIAPLIPELSAVQHSAIREMIVAVLFIVVLLWRPAGLIPEKRVKGRL